MKKWSFDVSKDDTLAVKGIAIMMMLVHHLFAFPARLLPGTSFNSLFVFADTTTLEWHVSGFCKVCVAIFTLLAGYGIFRSYSSKLLPSDEQCEPLLSFFARRLKKLYFKVWPVFIVFVPLGLILGKPNVKEDSGTGARRRDQPLQGALRQAHEDYPGYGLPQHRTSLLAHDHRPGVERTLVRNGPAEGRHPFPRLRPEGPADGLQEPTYFDTLNLDGKIFCDGGLWANDPIMVLESGIKNPCKPDKKACKEIIDDGFIILAFNTGMIHPNNAPKKKNALGWLNYIMDEWVARTGNSNYFEACANIGKENIFRCAPEVASAYEMDNLKKVKEVSDIWDKYYGQVKQKVLKFVKTAL